jgi:hypothetical protein
MKTPPAWLIRSAAGAAAVLASLGVSVSGVVSNVTLVGSNLGPAGSPLVVTYVSSADGLVRTATNCTRDPVGHRWVSCFGAVGVGRNHRWTVTVGGQSSAASVQTTSFVSPTLLDISGAGSRNANTDGGQIVVISGREFGPASATAWGAGSGLWKMRG